MKKSNRDDRGAVMVEFALILPLLMLILLGIIEFGKAYSDQVSIQAAAREGARELALGHEDLVDQRVRDAAPSVTITEITPSGCVDGVDGQATVTVKAVYTFKFLPLDPKRLEATGAMRCGL